MSEVQLNKEGLTVWKDVFPDGRVPVCELGFHPKSVHVGNEEYVLVKFKALSEKQKIAIIEKSRTERGQQGQKFVKLLTVMVYPFANP